MSAFRWTITHPLNHHRLVISVLRWAFHNARRRIVPKRDITLQFSHSLIEGPVGHPVINLIYYVRGGYYDYEAMTALRFLLQPGQGFIDIGANIGSYSVLAGELVGAGGRVFAVEPLSGQLPYLSRNLSRIQASSTICTAPLADRQRATSLAGVGPTTRYLDESARSQRVMTSTLDAELARIGWQSGGDFAKIDIEGWEPAAVLGATRWLASGPDGLILEANGLNRRCPIPWTEAVDVLRSHDMEFTWPSFHTRSLRIFEDPPPVSPSADYLVLSRVARRRLERSASLHSKAAGDE
jgi:FkbM family methyltransferase